VWPFVVDGALGLLSQFNWYRYRCRRRYFLCLRYRLVLEFGAYLIWLWFLLAGSVDAAAIIGRA
jgi:hypothetical protein